MKRPAAIMSVVCMAGIKHGLLFTVSYVGLANQDELNE